MSSWSGWMVATMSRIGPLRGRSISSRRKFPGPSSGRAVSHSARTSSSYPVSSPPAKPNRRRRVRPCGSAALAW
jgi:hypothetical protein